MELPFFGGRRVTNAIPIAARCLVAVSCTGRLFRGRLARRGRRRARRELERGLVRWQHALRAGPREFQLNHNALLRRVRANYSLRPQTQFAKDRVAVANLKHFFAGGAGKWLKLVPLREQLLERTGVAGTPVERNVFNLTLGVEEVGQRTDE